MAITRTLLCLVVAVVAGGVAGGVSPAAAAGQATAVASPAPAPRAFLDKYCVTCHNQRLKTAQLALDVMDVNQAAAQSEIWEKVVRKLRIGAMPPITAPRPDAAARSGFVSWLESSLDGSAAKAPNPGAPLLHRLNRAEYTNAIRDLLALDIDAKAMLPADDSGFGFDNIGDLLSVSPGLLERYMSAAERISRLAVGDPTIRPVVAQYSLPYMTLLQDDRMSPNLPFGSRGGIAVRHQFPVDGDYVFRIRVQRHSITLGASIRGLDDENQIDLRMDGARVKVFTLGEKGMVAPGGFQTGGGGQGAGGGQGRTQASDAGLEVRVPVKAGSRMVGVTFQKKTWYVEGVAPSELPPASHGNTVGTRSSPEFGRVDMGIDHLEIEGPFEARAPVETPSRKRIFTCRPDRVQPQAAHAACARTIVSKLARRAYRRPVTEADVAPLLSFYDAGRAEGGFDLGVQRALERLLVSPEFLFRAERDPATASRGGVYRVGDLVLASRLSFFLWSSIPDDELLDLAARGRLNDPVVLEQQVRRMLHDPRAGSLVENFFGQWLYVRNVALVRPDPKAFPEFDDTLREAFQTETRMFLDDQIRQDRSAVDLLTANYTFVNERLARHYGISNIYGSHFRRVQFNDDRRAGVLGQGGILTVLAYAHRTSPVVRGKWLLENVLGSPPPPPPADVPPFPEDEGESHPRSVRQRMEQHRKNAVCASCHSVMDPLGFAFENFNAVGKWRDTDGGDRVDASGSLPDGAKFSGPAEFRRALLQQRETFVLTLTTKLLTYAMGRGAEYNYDMPAIRKIVHDSSARDYRWSSLIVNIVKSVPFQMRAASAP